MNDAHNGDIVLNALLKEFGRLYEAAAEKAEEILRAYLRPRMNALKRGEDEASKDYAARLTLAFSGPAWALARRKIGKAFTEANARATEGINGGLEAAFVAGLNMTAYGLSLAGVDVLPMTGEVFAKLMAEHAIALRKRKLNLRKDRKYNEQRTQSAIHAAIFQGLDASELSGHVARSMGNGRKNEIVAAARASVYGAADQGAYTAGLEAEALGIEVEKTWLAIMDMRVRPSHSNLHGDTLPLHEKFKGLYGDLQYPHDPEAPPQETYHCRCRMAVHVAGKSPGEYSRFLLPSETYSYRQWRDKQIAAAGSELELLKKHRKLVK